MSADVSTELQSVQARIAKLESELEQARGNHGGTAPVFDRGLKRARESSSSTQNQFPGGSRVANRVSGGGDEYDSDEDGPKPKRTLESMVSLPVIDTKTRDEKLKEMNQSKAGAARARRMFSNLMGTLESCRKKEEQGNNKQILKLQEVERKLAEEKKAAIEKAAVDRREREQKAKDMEVEIKALIRKKAIIQYADNKVAQYDMMKKSIMTKTKPIIFFMPAKHNVRSLEMHNATVQKLDSLIDVRVQTMKEELQSCERSATNAQFRRGPPRNRGGERNRVSESFSNIRISPRRSRNSSRSRSRSYSRSESEKEEEVAAHPVLEEFGGGDAANNEEITDAFEKLPEDGLLDPKLEADDVEDVFA